MWWFPVATSSTSTEVLDLTEIVGDLEIPCDLGSWEDGCDRPAEWILHRNCCGVPALACDPCKVYVTGVKRAGMCAACGEVRMDDGPSRFSYIERLRKA